MQTDAPCRLKQNCDSATAPNAWRARRCNEIPISTIIGHLTAIDLCVKNLGIGPSSLDEALASTETEVGELTSAA